MKVLRDNAQMGARFVAEKLERSVRSVRHVAHRNRISLRPEGEKRGTPLGLPRGARLEDVPTLKEHQFDPKVLAELAQEVHRRTRGVVEDLCPECAMRPRVRSHGICLPCHLKGITETYREADRDRAAVQEAEREYSQERSRSYRDRKRSTA